MYETCLIIHCYNQIVFRTFELHWMCGNFEMNHLLNGWWHFEWRKLNESFSATEYEGLKINEWVIWNLAFSQHIFQLFYSVWCRWLTLTSDSSSTNAKIVSMFMVNVVKLRGLKHDIVWNNFPLMTSSKI